MSQRASVMRNVSAVAYLLSRTFEGCDMWTCRLMQNNKNTERRVQCVVWLWGDAADSEAVDNDEAAEASWWASVKKTKFNQLPDQTTVKSTTSVYGTPHFRSDAFQVATRRAAAAAGINCYRRTCRALTRTHTPSSECAGNCSESNERQIEVVSGCCCCCFSAPIIKQREATKRGTGSIVLISTNYWDSWIVWWMLSAPSFVFHPPPSPSSPIPSCLDTRPNMCDVQHTAITDELI